jgi:hypothetical protein
VQCGAAHHYSHVVVICYCQRLAVAAHHCRCLVADHVLLRTQSQRFSPLHDCSKVDPPVEHVGVVRLGVLVGEQASGLRCSCKRCDM